jgi:phosphatidylglycerophosphatase C
MAGKTLKSVVRASQTFIDDQVEDAGVVAFDFDGTLTVRDSFMAFLKWRVDARRFNRGLTRLIPSTLAYLGHRDRGKIKAAAVREFLGGLSREALEEEARSFAQSQSQVLLRPDAVQTWRRWRQRRATLVIVTASPEILIAPFARGLGADAVIGTELAFDADGFATGGFLTPNCRGPEKVRRLREMFGAELQLAAAYGDTSGDRAMLQIASVPGYRVFKERP